MEVASGSAAAASRLRMTPVDLNGIRTPSSAPASSAPGVTTSLCHVVTLVNGVPITIWGVGTSPIQLPCSPCSIHAAHMSHV